jgi:large subunit ribosomal protein L19
MLIFAANYVPKNPVLLNFLPLFRVDAPPIKKKAAERGNKMEQVIRSIASSQMKSDIPQFRAGDTVNVSVRVVEGDKERIQHFEGIVMQKKGAGINATFTVRKISNGVGVERIFPMHSPRIAKIDFVKAGQVRRAKLNYLRSLGSKDVRRKTT